MIAWGSAGVTWSLGAAVAAVHVTAAAAASDSLGPLYEDGGVFHTLAAGLAERFVYGSPDAFRSPGWPLLLAIPYRLFGAHPWIGLVLSAVLAGLTVVALIRLGNVLGLTGFQSSLAAVGYGIFPWTLIMGAALYSETLYNLIAVFLCLVIIRFRDRRDELSSWWWILPGLLIGYGTLVRSVLVFWIPAGMLFAFIVSRKRVDWRALAALCCGIALVLSVWTVRNAVTLDAFVPLNTAGGSTLATANNDESGAAQEPSGVPPSPDDEIAANRFLNEFATDWIKEHPAEFAARVPQRVVRTFDPVTKLNKGVVGSEALRWTARVLWGLLLILIALSLIHI